MKISKEQLLTLNRPGIAEAIKKMDDARFADYCVYLDEFIETFPDMESKLKSCFEARDNDSFSKNLLTVLDMLGKVHADDLAQSSFKLLQEVRAEKYDSAEAYLTNFLAAISSLSIDIQMAQHKDINQASASPAPAEDNSEGKTILAVDDVAFLLTMLKTALQNTAYKFVGVTSGVAALKFIENHKPDLFILDIEMPGMNGYELAAKIRQCGHTAPIIFLTGNATKDYVLKAIQAGGADFIVKPVNKEQMLEKIVKYIN